MTREERIMAFDTAENTLWSLVDREKFIFVYHLKRLLKRSWRLLGSLRTW